MRVMNTFISIPKPFSTVRVYQEGVGGGGWNKLNGLEIGLNQRVLSII